MTKQKKTKLAEWLWNRFSEASRDDVLSTWEEQTPKEQKYWKELAQEAITVMKPEVKQG